MYRKDICLNILNVSISRAGNLRSSLCDFDFQDSYQLFVSVKFNNKKCIVAAFYVQTTDEVSVDDYVRHAEVVEALAERHKDHKLLIMGDYNLPKFNGKVQCH